MTEERNAAGSLLF